MVNIFQVFQDELLYYSLLRESQQLPYSARADVGYYNQYNEDDFLKFCC